MSTNNWGRWGADDQSGALNLVTPDVVRAALGSVTRGQVISLAQPFGPMATTAPHRRLPARHMDRDAGDYALGARSPDGFRFAEDSVELPTHSSTHLDALCHSWEGETLYNRHSMSHIRSTTGAAACGAERLLPVVSRGLLLDVTEGGVPLEPGSPVGVEKLEDACANLGVEPRLGDVVLVRTGWWERPHDRVSYHTDEPGLTLAAAEWLAAHDVVVVGADNYAVEQQPSPPGSTFPVHLCLLHRHGIPLLENLDLSRLSAVAAPFLVVLAPLPLVGSTAGPLAPVAVL